MTVFGKPARAAFAALGLTLLPGLLVPTIAHADPPRDRWDNHDRGRHVEDHGRSGWDNAVRHDRNNHDNHWRANDSHDRNRDRNHDHDRDHHGDWHHDHH